MLKHLIKPTILFAFLALCLGVITLARASTAVSHSNTTTLTSGLVGYWTLDGNATNWTTGTTNDSSGNSNNGSLISMSTSTSPVAGKVGQALRFDGSSNAVKRSSLSAVAFGTGPFTVSAWFKGTTEPQDGTILASDGEQGGNSGLLWYTMSTPSIAVWPDGPGGGGITNVFDGKWHQIVQTRTGTGSNQGFVYVDGVLVNSGTDSRNLTGTTFVIGEDINLQHPGKGSIDDVRIYNRALSPQEVQQLYVNGGGVVAHSNTTTLTSGLVGYWTLDGNTTNWNAKTTQDSSGQGNTGTLTNFNTATTTAPVAGKIGGALKFDGINRVITLSGIAFSPNAPLTYSVWIKPASQVATYGDIGAQIGSKGFWYRGSSAGSNAGKISAFFGGDHHNNTALVNGIWNHYVFVYDGTTAHYYLNGQPDGSAVFATGPSTFTFSNIGADDTFGSEPFSGSLDDVRIYNRALSPQEVQQLYVNGGGVVAHSNATTLTSGLVGYWPLDGNTTNWATGKTNDSSGNGNNGSLISMSTTTSPAAGKIGGALKFNATQSQYITAGKIVAIASAPRVSVSAWFYRASANVNVMLGQTDIGGASNRFGMELFSDGKAYCIAEDASGPLGYEFVSTNVVGWHHFVAVFNGSLSGNNKCKLFIDGIEQVMSSDGNTPTATALAPSVSQSPFDIGRFNNTPSEGYTTGIIDDVCIYNRALSAQEVSQLYLLGK